MAHPRMGPASRGHPRTAQLRIIGNRYGVPQQGAMALRLLIGIAAAFPSEPGPAGAAGREAAA
jgi:hypothetical protein